MLIVRKEKRCKCPCHYRSIGFKNPRYIHCKECPKFNKVFTKKKSPITPQKQRSVLTTKLDDVSSLVVRIKGNWTCIKCHKRFDPSISNRTALPVNPMLTNSHYFNKTKRPTRWEMDNLDPICIFCHKEIENHKHEDVDGFNYEKYMLEKLGLDKFNDLRVRSESLADYDITQLQVMLAGYNAMLNAVMTR